MIAGAEGGGQSQGVRLDGGAVTLGPIQLQPVNSTLPDMPTLDSPAAEYADSGSGDGGPSTYGVQPPGAVVVKNLPLPYGYDADTNWNHPAANPYDTSDGAFLLTPDTVEVKAFGDPYQGEDDPQQYQAYSYYTRSGLSNPTMEQQIESQAVQVNNFNARTSPDVVALNWLADNTNGSVSGAFRTTAAMAEGEHRGVGNFVIHTVGGLANAVMHPTQTVVGIDHALKVAAWYGDQVIGGKANPVADVSNFAKSQVDGAINGFNREAQTQGSYAAIRDATAGGTELALNVVTIAAPVLDVVDAIRGVDAAADLGEMGELSQAVDVADVADESALVTESDGAALAEVANPAMGAAGGLDGIELADSALAQGDVAGVSGELVAEGMGPDAIDTSAATEIDGVRSVDSPGGCFVAGTLVHTRNGLRPIEDLRVGDFVLSQPENTGEQAYRRINETFVFKDKSIFEVICQDEHGRSERILATPNHPFWVKGIGWTGAEYLEAGQTVELNDGRDARVTSVRDTGETRQVFNFEVDGFHTYYVGNLGVWVHNDDCGSVSFRSFGALKRYLGSPGFGRQWHHIVEQSQIKQFGAAAIHSTDNVVSVSWADHIRISAYYSSKRPFTGGLTVRQWLKGQSWEDQYSFGRDVLSGRAP